MSGYYSLEYLNSPCGIIVFAFHITPTAWTHFAKSYQAAFDVKERTGVTPFYDTIMPATKNDNPGFLRQRVGSEDQRL